MRNSTPHPGAAPGALLALVVVLSSPVQAQELASRRESFVRELAADVAHQDSAAVRTVLAPHFPASQATQAAEAIRLLVRLGEQSGGLQVEKVEPLGANNTFVTVQSARQSRRALLNFGWNRTDSMNLRYVEVLKTWDPGIEQVVWAPASSLDSVVATIERNDATLASLGSFSGTVLVARHDSVVLAHGYGWADVADSTRNSVNTRFNIASMGKMFTAVAIGQLIEAGKLRLDDTLANVLPDYPNRDRARQITVLQLLTHTAGLGDLWSHPNYAKGGPYETNQQLAWAVSSGPTLFVPGTQWAYSNEGFAVLGAIVERVSGEPFDVYLRRHIWEPAGMRDITIGIDDEGTSHHAIGYIPADDDVLGVNALHAVPGGPGRANAAKGPGGEYATVTDLFRFAEALRSGKILSPAMRDTLWAKRNKLPFDPALSYASGFMRRIAGEATYVGHGGGGGYGIDDMFWFSPDGAWTIVVLGNYNPPGATELAAAIAKFLAASDRLSAGQ